MYAITFDMTNNHMDVHRHHAEPRNVMLVDAGEKHHDCWSFKRAANYLTVRHRVHKTIDIVALIAFQLRGLTPVNGCLFLPGVSARAY